MRLLKSFFYAFCGLIHCFFHERNFRIHVLAMVTVVIFGILYGLPIDKYPPLILCITLVMSLETVNTALERAVDLESPNSHPLAKVAKDSAAAGVLLAATGSVVIAVLTFCDGDKLIKILNLFKNPLYLIGLLVYIILGALFVFKLDSE